MTAVHVASLSAAHSHRSAHVDRLSVSAEMNARLTSSLCSR